MTVFCLDGGYFSVVAPSGMEFLPDRDLYEFHLLRRGHAPGALLWRPS